MNVSQALRARKSVRAFTSQPVAKEQIINLLEVARCAPSGGNTQPWNVAIVSGEAKQALQSSILSAIESGEQPSGDYQYYPCEWKDPYRSRRKACGLQLYSSLDITREDTQKQKQQWLANYRAFDAPVMLLFFIDQELAEGSYMDYGMFLQSVMLAAVEQGLATCPQAALAEFPHIVRNVLGYSESLTLLCGMALGYEDTTAIVNSYRTPREQVDSFTRFFDS